MTDYIKGILDGLEHVYDVQYKADLIVYQDDRVVGRWHLWCDRDIYGDKFVSTSFVECDECCANDEVDKVAEEYIQGHLNDGGEAWYSCGPSACIAIVGSKVAKTIDGRDYAFDLDIIVETSEKEEDE